METGKLEALECVQGPHSVYKGVSQLFHYITFHYRLLYFIEVLSIQGAIKDTIIAYFF